MAEYKPDKSIYSLPAKQNLSELSLHDFNIPTFKLIVIMDYRYKGISHGMEIVIGLIACVFILLIV
ncbi:MAG: hypothetical protein J7J15_02640, partial [Candidatus Aenigmarchaeota archaeon]|nr:hypothetical protein [Candidatus Aenigmarchaeota archaeon]